MLYIVVVFFSSLRGQQILLNVSTWTLLNPWNLTASRSRVCILRQKKIIFASCHRKNVSAETQLRRRLIHHLALRCLLVPAVPNAETGLRYLSSQVRRFNSDRDTPTYTGSEHSMHLLDCFLQATFFNI